MSADNRYLRGNKKQIRGTVAGSVTVEPGDLVGVNYVDGYYGAGGKTLLNQANGYVYPLSYCRPVSGGTAMDIAIGMSFAGVALTGSAAGTTNEVVVGIDGIARYPIIVGPSSVTIGARVSAVSGTDQTGTSNQTVAVNITRTPAHSSGTTGILGVCVKTESGASFVDFQLWTYMLKGKQLL